MKPNRFPEDSDPSDEPQLIAAAARGDGSSFSRLYERYYKVVARRLSHLLGPRVAAATIDDAAQETFLRAMRALPGFCADAPFRVWLLRIAISVARDEQRRQKRSLWQLLTGADELEAVAPARAAAADAYADLRAVHDALAKLSPRLREVVVLFELEGENLADIAAELDIPLHTVGSRLRRGRTELREILVRAGYGERVPSQFALLVGERT